MCRSEAFNALLRTVMTAARGSPLTMNWPRQRLVYRHHAASSPRRSSRRLRSPRGGSAPSSRASGNAGQGGGEPRVLFPASLERFATCSQVTSNCLKANDDEAASAIDSSCLAGRCQDCLLLHLEGLGCVRRCQQRGCRPPAGNRGVVRARMVLAA